MALEDQHLDRLVNVAMAARHHQIAIGLKEALRDVNWAAGPTLEGRAEIEAADLACEVSEKALKDYQWRKL
jgi:predicted outer membrane protein